MRLRTEENKTFLMPYLYVITVYVRSSTVKAIIILLWFSSCHHSRLD